MLRPVNELTLHPSENASGAADLFFDLSLCTGAGGIGLGLTIMPPLSEMLASPIGQRGITFHLTPVVNRLAEHLRASTKLFMDETTAPVLDPGRGKTKTGYLWALARDDRGWGGEDPPGVVYFYADGRGGKHAEEFLAGFNGILQVDAYAGYNRLTKNTRSDGALTLAYCWAHARRKLKEVHDSDASPIAAEGLRRIAEFYKIEAEIRDTSAGQRMSARQTVLP